MLVPSPVKAAADEVEDKVAVRSRPTTMRVAIVVRAMEVDVVAEAVAVAEGEAEEAEVALRSARARSKVNGDSACMRGGIVHV